MNQSLSSSSPNYESVKRLLSDHPDMTPREAASHTSSRVGRGAESVGWMTRRRGSCQHGWSALKVYTPMWRRCTSVMETIQVNAAQGGGEGAPRLG
jgi:hypothetical protein